MKTGNIEMGIISSVKKIHVLVDFDDGYKGILHISNVSDYFVSSLNYIFKKGAEYQFKIISVDAMNKRVKLDWKSIHPRFLRNPFSYSIKETNNEFKNLYNKTMKEINND
ncbi:MAG: S1 RNA-binding domain-containing protein [Mycoplasmatales bacterium]|nr:S1 RNA-binding domain-containing protein [Mycoplasmatales bacterium]